MGSTFTYITISHVEQRIAASDGRKLDLTDLWFRDGSITEEVLQKITTRMPGLNELHLQLSGGFSHRHLREFLLHAYQFRFPCGQYLLSRITSLTWAFWTDEDTLQPESLDDMHSPFQPLSANDIHRILNGAIPLTQSMPPGDFSQLQILDISGSQANDAGIKYILQLLNVTSLPQLHTLRIEFAALTDSSFTLFADVATTGGLSLLKTLVLNGTKFTDDSIHRLGEAARTGQILQLQTLAITRTQISDASMRLFGEAAGLGYFAQLESLDLSLEKLTDVALTPIAEAARGGRLSRLRRLNLSHTQITDVTVCVLSRSAKELQQF